MDDRRPDNQGLVVDIELSTPTQLSIALSCARGQTLALFGASGSGKTTSLRTIAGLSRGATGKITVNGTTWLDSNSHVDLPPHLRSVGYVFQEYALFPHLSALENVASALSHLPRARRVPVARDFLARMHLQGFEARRPAELSGGQRQRVALARALAREPQVLLLDEPFSAVDAPVRVALYRELVELRRSLSLPIVFVTHDFTEVLRFADSVAVLEKGKVVAHGSVNEICNRDDLPIMQAQADPATAIDAVVSSLQPERKLIQLDIGGQYLLAPLIDAPVGTLVRARISAREVVLATEMPKGLSIRNRLSGRINKIVGIADGTTVAVHIAVSEIEIVAHITRDAVNELSLSPGSPVIALIKSVSVDTMERAVAQLPSTPLDEVPDADT